MAFTRCLSLAQWQARKAVKEPLTPSNLVSDFDALLIPFATMEKVSIGQVDGDESLFCCEATSASDSCYGGRGDSPGPFLK